MKFLKKKAFFLLLVAALFTVTACSGNTTQNDESSSASNLSSDVSVTSTEESSISATESSNTSEAQSEVSSEPTGNVVEYSWFDDAVFVGDSVTLKLSYYCDENLEALGNAQFFCAGSLGYTNALWELDHEDAVHPTYKGETYLAENCTTVTGASKVFVMLGMNDVGLYGVDGALESAETLLDNIKKNSPDAIIYVQSVTPIMEEHQGSSWNNEIIREFNKKLKNLCSEKKYGFLDVYSVMADENGNLPDNYCSDPDAMGIHFTDEACQVWVNYLKSNVASAIN